MDLHDSDDPAARLQAHILERIPLARAMQLSVTRFSGGEIEMRAPLQPNINDKGCAFGGSMASLMTLAGWGLIELGLRARGLACDIYVGDTQLRYREPVWGELRAVARYTEAGEPDRLAAALHERGKGRAGVVCEIAGETQPAASLAALFFARRHA